MNKYVKMIIALSLIALISGILLGGLNELTKETIENNVLKFKKIPAAAHIFEIVSGKLSPEERVTVEENLLSNKRSFELEENKKVTFFVVQKEGQPYAATIESFGKGFGGDLGVMTGFHLQTGEIVGIGITTLSETPGLGSRVTEMEFSKQFSSLGKDSKIMVKKDGGEIDAITGATISSRAVCAAIANAQAVWEKHHEKIVQASQ